MSLRLADALEPGHRRQRRLPGPVGTTGIAVPRRVGMARRRPASSRTQHSTPSSWAGNGLPRAVPPVRRAADRATGTPACRTRPGAVARSAPRCGHARGATSSPPSAPRQATICTPGDRRSRTPSWRSANSRRTAYQLPLGPALRAAQRRSDHRRVGVAIGRRLRRPVQRRQGLERPGSWPALARSSDSALIAVALPRRSPAGAAAPTGRGWGRCAARAPPDRNRRAARWRPSTRSSRRVPSAPRAGRCESRHRPAPPADRVSATVGRSAKSPGREPRAVVAAQQSFVDDRRADGLRVQLVHAGQQPARAPRRRPSVTE